MLSFVLILHYISNVISFGEKKLDCCAHAGPGKHSSPLIIFKGISLSCPYVVNCHSI